MQHLQEQDSVHYRLEGSTRHEEGRGGEDIKQKSTALTAERKLEISEGCM